MDAPGETLQIHLDQRTDYKVLQLDAREVMVAFKSAALAPAAGDNLSGTGMIRRVSVETLPDRVVSLMLETAADVREVRAQWQETAATLEVRLVSDGTAGTVEIPVKRRKFQKNIDTKSQEADAATSPVSSPEEPVVPAEDEPITAVPALAPAPAPVQASKAPAGDAFLAEISGGACATAPVMEEALMFCRDDRWGRAFELLDAEVDPYAVGECQAERYYLRAYAAYKMNTAGNDRLYLDAVSYFQEALSYFPEASCAPLATLTLAVLYTELGSGAEAKGYYKLILKTYPDHGVAAEALLNLGKLYASEEKQEQAISIYRQYLKTYPGSRHVTDARLALGKSLYEISEYEEALSLLTRVISDDPGSIYTDQELLLDLGNCYYQLGRTEAALETMTQAVNLFPESGEAPVLLTRIGDILKGLGRTEKAKKIYERVMTRYPETDGAAVSAVRYAGLLPEIAQKEAQYRKVIEAFPGHPMAKLAVIRLADLQNQEGKYAAGIETMRSIMSGNLKDLQNEAEYVMAASFDGYFRELSKEGDFLAVVTAYEKDRALINRFENPDVFERVGAAFLEGKFYSRAEDLFQKAYGATSVTSRPASLYYRLAVTLQALGKKMQAKEMFHAYFKSSQGDDKNPDAYLQMGQLLVDDEEWDRAMTYYRTGLALSTKDAQKAEFLSAQAEVYEKTGKYSEAPDLLVKAINLMAGLPEASQDQLMIIHRRLGELYMKLSAFQKAVDAFTMALNFSGGTRPPALLYQLAESQLKAGDLEAARSVLDEVIGTGDAFWSRMAREHLRNLDLQERLGQVPMTPDS